MESYVLSMPIISAFRLKKTPTNYIKTFLLKKCLQVASNLCYTMGEREEMRIMPNQHRCDLRQVIIRLEIEICVQLQKFAKAKNRTVTQILREIITEMVSDVELTSNDYREIAEEVARNEAKRNRS